jgi:hypothetical protein
VKLICVWLHICLVLVTSCVDLVTRGTVRLCASICDTGLNLAVNWLSIVEFAEKLQSAIWSVRTAWLERRQLYKINCGVQRASSVITSLFLCFHYQASQLELRRVKNQRDGNSAECNTSASRYKSI